QETLTRHHENNASVAPQPPGFSPNGNWGHISHVTYDGYGNAVRKEGAAGECSDTIYDADYQQMPSMEKRYAGGCGSPAPLVALAQLDPGFGAATMRRDASGAQSETDYDSLGRPIAVRAPHPGVPGLAMAQAVVRFEYSAPVDGPFHAVHTI